MKLILLVFVVFVVKNGCRCSSDSTGYVENKALGRSYNIVYKAETWHVAKDNCAKEGAKLSVPKSKEEFDYIQHTVRKMCLSCVTGARNKVLVYLGINNLEDYTIWKNVDGENIQDTGYHTWVTDYHKESRPDPKEPHCAGVDAINPGLREFWCHLPQPYICEKIVQT